MESATGHFVDVAVRDQRPERRPWSMTTRVLFRFAFVYLALYMLVPLFFFAQTNLNAPFLRSAQERFWRSGLSFWAASHVFGTTQSDTAAIGGDALFSWIQIVWLLTIAAVATVFWSALDRHRQDYRRLHEWLRVVVRITLALVLTSYGADKIWPSQFPLARPHQLLGQLGDYAPAQLLWVFIGASRGYETFTGTVELLAAALLFVPRLTTLGALVALGAMTNVFMLNVFYDVTVKSFSLHLGIMALFLLLPDARRLVDVLVLNRSTAPRDAPPLFRRRGLVRAAAVVQIATGVAAITQSTLQTKSRASSMNVFDKARVPWYGVWTVTDFSVDGVPRQPLTTDDVRWQRLVFDWYFNASVQRMNGAVIPVRTRTDPGHTRITFDHAASPDPETRERYGPNWKADFTVEMRSPDVMLLHGRYNGQPAEIVLHRDDAPFPLTSHDVHWVLRSPLHVSPYF